MQKKDEVRPFHKISITEIVFNKEISVRVFKRKCGSKGTQFDQVLSHFCAFMSRDCSEKQKQVLMKLKE